MRRLLDGSFVLPTAQRRGLSISDSTYSIASGLPAGLAFDPATRYVTGTPTVAGNYSLLYKIVDGSDDAEAFIRYEFQIEEPSAAGPPTNPDAPGNIRQSSDETTSGTLKMRLNAPSIR